MDAGLLPVKNPLNAKRRLARALEPGAHRELTAALLEDALALCGATDGVRWWIVSDDPLVRARAEEAGFDTLTDTGTGLNDALQAGIEAVGEAGADSVTIVPVDVPLARPEDARDLLDTGATSDVVVVPATDGGTNGLFLDLPTRMEPSFGPASLNKHVAQAGELGLRCSILDLPRLSVDLDTPDDARLLLDSGEAQGRTLQVLVRYFG